jgi:predicted dehydrogenase
MIKVAVIGVGNMGKNHARVYSELKGVELVAVADMNEEIGSEVAKRFDAKYYRDYHGILGKVDAVSIVVPTKLHYKIAKDFLENGVDVLLEKPITLNLEEASELIGIAKGNGRILQVGHIERFNPAVLELPRYLDSNIIAIESKRIGPSGARITDAGVILDLMIHDIDIILSIIGGNLKGLSSYSRKITGNHEDFACATMEFENGVIASLIASRCTQKRERLLKITLEDKYVVVDYMNKTIEIHKRAKSEYVAEGKGSKLVYSDVVEKPQVSFSEPLKLELESFIEAVKERSEPKVSGEDGRRALEVALKMLE